MKFSLAFASMALAADNQSPVISLDLSALDCGTCHNTATRASAAYTNVGLDLTPNNADGSVRAYGDECEVDANRAAGVTCSLPTVTAADHHNGPADVTEWTDTYVYAKAEVKSDLFVCTDADVTNKACPVGVSSAIRSENIMHYQARDLSGNEAESISFTIIYTDSEQPVCAATAPTPSCRADGSVGEFTYYGGNITRELSWTDCTDPAAAFVDWAPDTMSTTDLVDGTLTPLNSKMTRFLSVTDLGGTSTVTSNGRLTFSSNFQSLSAVTTYDYAIESEDFASIFGTNGANNQYAESGSLTVNDTTIPVITVGALPDAECGFQVTAPMDTASYADCFDDLAAVGGRAKNTITAVINFATNQECYQGRGLQTGGHTVASTGYGMEIVYSVSDHFSNQAASVTKSMVCHDTIKPTLYITQLSARGTETLQHDNNLVDLCSGGITNETNGTVSHCTSFNHGNGFTTYHHVADGSTWTVSDGYDPNMNGMTIEHSAGSEAGYALPTELLTEGTGYSCIDICSQTTSTATWTAACNDATPGTAFTESTVGTFFLRYSCVDAAGNDMTACRSFINLDKTRPVLNVVNQSNDASGFYILKMDPANSYQDEGATCTDVIDGNISRDIVVTGDNVDLMTLGTYIITYNCADSAGNDAIENHRTVVVKASDCPYCASLPNSDYTIEASFPYTDASTTCTDSVGQVAITPRKECTASIGTCKNNGVDLEQTGVFTITYSATDQYGNGIGDNNANGILCHSDMVDDVNDPKPWQYRIKTVTVEDSGFGFGANGGITLRYKGTVIHAAHQTGMPAGYMAESMSSLNGWVIGAVASAVSGVAILGYASTRKSNIATSVPV